MHPFLQLSWVVVGVSGTTNRAEFDFNSILGWLRRAGRAIVERERKEAESGWESGNGRMTRRDRDGVAGFPVLGYKLILTFVCFQVRKAIRPWTPRNTLQPGTVLILLAGRFRGKRVVLLKNLEQGVLLVTGPFKINGVPLRRVNSRYVIATSMKVDLAGIDEAKVEEISRPKYFTAEKAKEKAGEEAFFKQGEKPQVRAESGSGRRRWMSGGTDTDAQKKEVSSSRAADQKAIDKALLANIKKVDMLASYLATSFSLRKGDKPHMMKW